MKAFAIFLLTGGILSCGQSKKITAGHVANQQSSKESLQQKFAAGTDLYAQGSSPATWTLEVDFDRIINFRSLDGTNYNSTAAQPVQVPGDQFSTITTKANTGEMVIRIFTVPCSNSQTGELFNKKVTVEVDGRQYAGCGQYLSDNALAGKWILQNIDAKPVAAAAFAKGLPELSFDVEAGKLTGHDGCNRINSAIEVQGNRIRFAGIVSTKMACPANKKENEFIQKLSDKVATYYFKDGLLILYLVDDSTLGFRKG